MRTVVHLLKPFRITAKKAAIGALWRIYNWRLITTYYWARSRHGPGLVVQRHQGDVRPSHHNAAVVVASYLSVFHESTMRQIRALDDEGFDVFLVWNGELPEEVLAAAAPHCVEVIERMRFGYDWAGYKVVIDTLTEDSAYMNAGLFLSNDSFYFFSCTPAHLRAVLSLRADVRGLVLNKESRPHMMGAFFFLTAKARNSASVQEFWRKYTPSWDKRASIYEGELKHSQCVELSGLTRAAALPAILMANPSTLGFVANKSRRLESSDFVDDKAAPIDQPFDYGAEGCPRGTSMHHDAESELSAVREWGILCETTSVIHQLGPFLSAGWGLPLKLDLVNRPDLFWSELEISWILSESFFLSDQDKLELREHFSNSPSWASYSGITQFFFKNGFTI